MSHPSSKVRNETALDRFVRTSDVMKTLSRSEQRKKEAELRRLEEVRDERAREESEVVDLQPVPTENESPHAEERQHESG